MIYKSLCIVFKPNDFFIIFSSYINLLSVQVHIGLIFGRVCYYNYKVIDRC